MKLSDKLQYLQTHHIGEWIGTRQEVEEELSDGQSMFCICRRLATGFHESGCRQFQTAVSKETAKRLEHLIVVTKEAA